MGFLQDYRFINLKDNFLFRIASIQNVNYTRIMNTSGRGLYASTLISIYKSKTDGIL